VARRFIKYWKLLNASAFVPPLIDDAIHAHVLSKLTTQLTDGTRWANTFRTQFGSRYSTPVPCDIAIITPDTAKATEAAIGANVNLSAALMSQNGTTFTDGTFKWSVVEPGAALTATTGTSTTFSADASGMYTVKVWDSRWPDQFEDEQIFIGDWNKPPTTGATTGKTKHHVPLSLKIIRTPRSIVIKSPIAGKLSIVSLQGRVVQSILMGKAGTFVWDIRGTAGGLYLVYMRNETQTLRSKLYLH
jgi:hypothetical protein